MRGNNCRLFALNQSDWFMLVGIKKMLSEKALTKVVVWAFEQTMYPCDMWLNGCFTRLPVSGL